MKPLRLVGAACLLTMSISSGAAQELSIPVLWGSPGCKHAKLGTVAAEAGMRVSEGTQDTRPTPVRSISALVKLSQAAQAKGGNAVVLRSHQGLYFTKNGRQSKGPVFIKLRGAVIRLPDDLDQCELTLVSADEIDSRMRSRKPKEVTSRQAYTDLAESED